MSNGCGCETGLFSRLRPPYAELFDIPCRMHDDDYDAGAVTRSQADRLLFRRMCRTVSGMDCPPPKSMWLLHVALLYWVAVRLFGGRYYKKQNKKKNGTI